MPEPGPPPPPPDPIMVLPSRLTFELAKVARRLFAQMYPEDALRFPRVMVLAAIAQHGPMSQREVSTALDIDPGDLVGLIDALEDLEFLVRSRDPRDRRRYKLELTEKGRLALHERRCRAIRMNEELFAGLTELERADLERLLLKTLAHHDERFGQDCPPAFSFSGPPDRRNSRTA